MSAVWEAKSKDPVVTSRRTSRAECPPSIVVYIVKPTGTVTGLQANNTAQAVRLWSRPLCDQEQGLHHFRLSHGEGFSAVAKATVNNMWLQTHQ